jgi:hypothetical protein
MSTKSFVSKEEYSASYILVKLRLNPLGSSSGIALTGSYVNNYANDPFFTLKVGHGQPKAF